MLGAVNGIDVRPDQAHATPLQLGDRVLEILDAHSGDDQTLAPSFDAPRGVRVVGQRLDDLDRTLVPQLERRVTDPSIGHLAPFVDLQPQPFVRLDPFFQVLYGDNHVVDELEHLSPLNGEQRTIHTPQ